MAEYFEILGKLHKISRYCVHNANYRGDEACNAVLKAEAKALKKCVQTKKFDSKNNVQELRCFLEDKAPVEIKKLAQNLYNNMEKYFKSSKLLMKNGNWRAIKDDKATEQVFNYMKECRENTKRVNYHVAYKDFEKTLRDLSVIDKENEIALNLVK